MSGDVTPYLNLIPSANQTAPKFTAMISATLQPCADMAVLSATIPGLFDVDVAVGQQLDCVGQWVGVNRHLSEPLKNVVFSFDFAVVGFDLGVWIETDTLYGGDLQFVNNPQGNIDFTNNSGGELIFNSALLPGDAEYIQLSDDFYRLIIKAKILNNAWDCTIPTAYKLINTLFLPLGYELLIKDNGDLTMTLFFVSLLPIGDLNFTNDIGGGLQFVNNEDGPLTFIVVPQIPPLLLGMFTSGLFDIKPIGIEVNYSSSTAPLFAFDTTAYDVDVTTLTAGLDEGSWTTYLH